jgi:hypothetical protein
MDSSGGCPFVTNAHDALLQYLSSIGDFGRRTLVLRSPTLVILIQISNTTLPDGAS